MAGASLSGRTPGEDIWVRIWENTNNDNGKFKICVTEQSIEPYDVFGIVAYCQGDTGVSITLSGSTPGIDYTLILNDTIRQDTIPGNGGPLIWSPVQLEGIYRIMGEVPGSGYMVLMNDSVKVEILPLPQLSFDIASVTCFEADNGSIFTTVSGAEPYQFDWSGPDEYTSVRKDPADLPPGIYLVSVRDNNLCSTASSPLTITQPDLLVASLNLVTHLTAYGANDGAIEIGITGGTAPYTQSWTGTDGYSSEELLASGMTVGYYSVRVTDSHLCMDSILMIMVSVDEHAEEVFIPEGFSPNGDGFNDRFVILGLENFPENELMVFNRQGVEVFHRVNYENDWDGRPESGSILGGVLPEGTYYYIFKFGEQNIRKGTIYLNRE
jgi:gliding motility-associated-like protein